MDGNARSAYAGWKTKSPRVRALVGVLNAIHKQDFLGFSYGFRPKRSPDQALDALTIDIETRRVDEMLGSDIHGFFYRG